MRWLWVGVAGMVLGVVGLGWAGRGRAGGPRAVALVAAALPLSAGSWYLLMALGVAAASTPAGPVLWGRYADGVVTIPLLVLGLGLLAGADRRSIARAMVVGAADMAATLAASLTAGPAKLAWLGGSVVGFAVLVGLLVRLTAGAGRRIRLIRNVVVALWLLYPVVWVLGPAGFALAPRLPLVPAGLALDLALKPGVGALLLWASDAA